MEGERKEKRSCLRRQLRKTKMCVHFSKGECHFGSECAFAHDEKELQDAPDLRKTRLCQRFIDGFCDDVKCSFAHGEGELRSTDLFFKKTICIWNEKGKCRAGDQCRFAHGAEELRGPLPAGAPPEQPPEGELPSVGSKGHPDSCEPPCKYHWKKRGCKDGTKCNRCHICKWRPDNAGRGGKKRKVEDADESSGDEQPSGKRLKGSLDEHGNSRPSWLREDSHGGGGGGPPPHPGACVPWDPYRQPPPGYGSHVYGYYGAPSGYSYGGPPGFSGYPPPTGYAPGTFAA